MIRNFRRCGPPRRRNNIFLIVMISVLSTIFILYTLNGSQFPKEERMERNIAHMQTRLQFLESLYLARSEDILKIQNKVFPRRNYTGHVAKNFERHDQITPEIVMMLKNMTGMKSAAGVFTKIVPVMENSFILKLLPHIGDAPSSLRPSYHLKSKRHGSEYVIAIPTVKRDKQSYLMVTLEHLVGGLREKDKNDTIIVVFVGESDLEYVLTVARDIETEFQKEVEDGMIEVISPSATYYPDLDSLPLSLGDSLKRVKWRTKQNLDTIFLMAYAQTRGTYYLMLEDDVIATDNYMQEIKQFVSATTITNPDWFILEFCHVGGIGKLFKSSELINFIVYVQLFYKNMPIDWLMESYLADRVCTIDKYSDPRYGKLPLFYPHDNPTLKFVRVTIKEKGQYTVKNAYDGKSFFWGFQPKKGEVIEFWFAHPTRIASYTFRSGNVEHQSDKFYDTVVEIYTVKSRNFITIDRFDEFGLADGKIEYTTGPLLAIRLRVTKDSLYWVVLSEIELKTRFDIKYARQSDIIKASWTGMAKNYLPGQKFTEPFEKKALT